MESYTRLFSGIVRSTIWDEPHTVRIVWVTMLALADRSGTVWASLPGLAHEARVTLDECSEALKLLLSPDEHSRTTEDDGRRIRVVDGGWLLINHEKYRESGGDKEANRQRQARYRGRQKARNASNALPVTKTTLGDGESPPAPAPTPALEKKVSRAAHARAPGGEHPGFEQWYHTYPRRVNRKVAERSYRKALGKLGEDNGLTTLLRAALAFKSYCRRTAIPLDKTPHPSTWLNQERWENDYTAIATEELKSASETRHDPGSDRRAARAAEEHDDGERPIPTL